MKSIITALITSTISLTALAGVNGGEGYYRVQNYRTERYVRVTDNRGSLNMQATTAELGAIELWKGQESAISDPATVIYVIDLEGKGGKGRDFDLQTQGTGVKSIIDYPVSIIENMKTTPVTHRLFGRNSGLTRYIGDGTASASVIDMERGYTTSQLEGNDEANFWIFHKITTDDSQYFGITPEFQNGDDYYATLYAGFPFSTASEGMTVYYVSRSGNGLAALKEVTGTVPAGTPVVVKCSSATPKGNKLNIGGNASAISGNKLGGVYFHNEDILVHKNLTPYDKETMRVLGTLSDGSIGFVTADFKYLPRNKAYLTVPAGSPAEIRLVSEEEYDKSGITSVTTDNVSVRIQGMTLIVEGDVSNVEVYTVTGQLVRRGNISRLQLPAPGIYIVKAGNKVSKLIAK